MHPVLLRLGPITIHTYGLLVATGMVVTLLLSRRRAPRFGLDPDRVWNLGIYMTLSGLVGAKLWYVASNWDYYSANPREIFSLSTLEAAGVFYGGLLTGLAVAYFYVRRQNMRFLPLVDNYAAPVALGHAFGRLGCFSAGCCWGKATEVSWGVTFSDPYAAQIVGVPLGLRLHPTQLYEAAAELVIFGLLMGLSARRRFDGQIFASYAILYGLARFIIEFFRGDFGRGHVFGTEFSVMQAVSLGLIVLGIYIWLRFSKTGQAKLQSE